MGGGEITQMWIFFIKLSVLHSSKSLHDIRIQCNRDNFAAGGQILAAAKSGKIYFAQ